MQSDWKRWFSGGSRARRQEYWSVYIVTTLGGAAVHAALATIVLALPSFAAPAVVIFIGTQLAAAWALVCATARRLHDLGRSGWWQAIPLAVALVGAIAAEPAWGPRFGLSPEHQIGFWATAVIVTVGFAIIIGLLPGRAADNRFGPAAA